MRAALLVLAAFLLVPGAGAHFYEVHVPDLPIGPDVGQQIDFTFEFEENGTYYIRIESSRPRAMGVNYDNMVIDPRTPPGKPYFDNVNVSRQGDIVLRLNNTGAPGGQIAGSVNLTHLDSSQATAGRSGYNFTAILVGYEGSHHGITQSTFHIGEGDESPGPAGGAPGVGALALLVVASWAARRLTA